MKPSAHNLSLLDQSIIYQVFTGRWESANVIDHRKKVFEKLKSLPFEKLNDLGVDTVYLLGVFDNAGPVLVNVEEGEDISGHADRVPSIFSISDHKNTNQNLGTVSDLKDLISTLHQKGFKVILDFVANHTSTTHPWVTDHPGYYVDSHKGFVAEFSGDVYKLDYSNPTVWSQMISVLETIADWGADGVRCDMTHLVPLDFWKEAISKIKNDHPKFAFISEAYTSDTFSFQVVEDHIFAGFDAVYHQQLYENLKKVYKYGEPKEHLSSHIDYIRKRSDINNKLVSYISNHDDPFPGVILEKEREEMLEMVIGLPGPALIYNGFTKGFNKRLAHHYIDILPSKFNEVNNYILESVALGIDIGGTKITSAIIDSFGKITEKNRENIPVEKEPEQIIDSIIKQINIYIDKGYEVRGVGVSIPGFVDDSGEVLFAGDVLKNLVGTNIPNSINEKLSRRIEIVVENDAYCFALAEAVFGAGKSSEVVIGIIWGSGVGSGIVVNNKVDKVIDGEIGGAGEFGHIVLDPNSTSKDICGCGQNGCLEMLASGKSIERRYRQLGGIIQDATVKEIYNSDEEVAKTVISDAIRYLSLGISYLVNLINPGVVVLGGGVSLLPDEVYEKIKEEVSKNALKSLSKELKIVRHQISDDAGVVGAASLVI